MIGSCFESCCYFHLHLRPRRHHLGVQEDQEVDQEDLRYRLRHRLEALEDQEEDQVGVVGHQ